MWKSTEFNIDLSSKDNDVNTAFHYSCKYERSKIAEMIVKQSQNFNIDLNSKDEYGRTAFHHASMNGRTLTDPNASCPRSLLKTTPPPPGCPWVPGGPEVTPEPSFRGLVLDHQV